MDNLEDYYYFTVKEYYQDYINYLDRSENTDPDYPGFNLEFKE